MAPAADMILVREDGHLKSVSRLDGLEWPVEEDQIGRYCLEWGVPRLDLEYEDSAHLHEMLDPLVVSWTRFLP